MRIVTQPLTRRSPSSARIAGLPLWLQRAALACILAAGTALRFYQLGADSLWLDEAGVAYAARAETLTGMLQVVRSHVLAMPLDYLIAWLVGKVSQAELALRIPSAVWGSLTLYLAYRFFRRFTGRPAALLGLLVLALSPLHIQYSQELRFYASLVFFYLLAALALWDALQQPTRWRWIRFNAACILGIFFHPYVLFCLTNGLVWLALAGPAGWRDRRRRFSFMLSACLVLLAFLGGYLVFSASNVFEIPLLVFEDSFITAIAAGLGWLPFFAGQPGLSWVYGGLCAGVEILGVWAVVARDPRSPMAGLAYSLVLQIAAVLGSDLLGHYFFAPRQILFLLPLLCLFAGVGLASIIETASSRMQAIFQNAGPGLTRAGLAGLTALLVIAASLPAIRAYHEDDKGSSREIVQTILADWQAGDTVLIVPAYEGFVYKYYVEYVYRRQDVAGRLWASGWEDLRDSGSWPGALYVITPAQLTGEEAQLMQSLGFSPLIRSHPRSRYARVLWSR